MNQLTVAVCLTAICELIGAFPEDMLPEGEHFPTHIRTTGRLWVPQDIIEDYISTFEEEE